MNIIFLTVFATAVIVGLMTLYVRRSLGPRREGFKSDPLKDLKKIIKFFNYLGKFFKWLGNIISCSFETVINLPSCWFYYVFDMFIGFVTLIIKAICSFSSTLESARKTIWGLMVKLDKYLHEYSGYHIVQYPDSVVKKCYKCKNVKMPKM